MAQYPRARHGHELAAVRGQCSGPAGAGRCGGLSLDLRREARAWDGIGEGLNGSGCHHSLQPSLTLSTVPTGVVLGYTEDN